MVLRPPPPPTIVADPTRCDFCRSTQHALVACKMPGVVQYRAELAGTATSMPARDAVAVRRWCGIDPGQDVGLCAVAVPADGPHRHDIVRGRLIGHATVRASQAKALTTAATKAELFARVMRRLVEWGITDVVVEEPSEVPTRSWKAAEGQRVRGQSIGTVFWQGAHYGLCIAAARAAVPGCALWAYPPNTPRRRVKHERDTGEVVRGWMQGYATVATPRGTTLAAMRALLVQLKQRPESGVLPTRDELRGELSEHERMALGVLNYHLQRERGRA